MNGTTHIDANFIQRLQAHDREAFGQLYDAYSGALYGIALRMMGSEALGEDVLQESFIKIWKHLPTYDSAKGSIFTWMLNVTRNTAIDALRSSKTRPTTSFNDEVATVVEQNSALNINTNIIGVKELVAQLKPEFAEAINAVYFTGLTHDEAAEALNLPLGTLKTRVRGALTELKRIFALLLLWISMTI